MKFFFGSIALRSLRVIKVKYTHTSISLSLIYSFSSFVPSLFLLYLIVSFFSSFFLSLCLTLSVSLFQSSFYDFVTFIRTFHSFLFRVSSKLPIILRSIFRSFVHSSIYFQLFLSISIFIVCFSCSVPVLFFIYSFLLISHSIEKLHSFFHPYFEIFLFFSFSSFSSFSFLLFL